MSNQLYSNGTRKYAPLPGVNIYQRVDNITVDGATSAIINFPTTQLEQGLGITTSGERLTFLKTGYYSVKYFVAYQIADPGFDLHLTFGIRVVATGKYLDLSEYAVTGGGTLIRGESLSNVGYFSAGDQLEFDVYNALVGEGAVVLANGSQLIVTQIF